MARAVLAPANQHLYANAVTSSYAIARLPQHRCTNIGAAFCRCVNAFAYRRAIQPLANGLGEAVAGINVIAAFNFAGGYSLQGLFSVMSLLNP